MKGRREYEYISNKTLSVIFTSIGNSSLALFSVILALLDRSKKYLNRKKQQIKPNDYPIDETTAQNIVIIMLFL